MRALHVFSLAFSLVFLPVVVGAGAARAQSSGPSPAPSGAAQPAPPGDGDPAARPKPKLGLDSLLTPRGGAPRSAPAPAAPTEETYGGRNRQAWDRTFADAYAERYEAQLALEKSKKRLSEVSKGGGYTYSPLGGTAADSAPTDPEVQKAKAQRDRDRKAAEVAEKRVRELTVEASLAGVPDAWIPRDLSPRGAPASEPAPADSSRPQ
jgi:hypothetical protein